MTLPGKSITIALTLAVVYSLGKGAGYREALGLFSLGVRRGVAAGIDTAMGR